jgi:hypothetical protein
MRPGAELKSRHSKDKKIRHSRGKEEMENAGQKARAGPKARYQAYHRSKGREER